MIYTIWIEYNRLFIAKFFYIKFFKFKLNFFIIWIEYITWVELNNIILYHYFLKRIKATITWIKIRRVFNENTKIELGFYF